MTANRFEARTRIELTSETMLQGAINSWTRALSASNWKLLKKTFSGDAQITLDLVINAASRRGEPFSKFVSKRKVLTGCAKTPFAGNMMLVVDNKCTSACELAVLTARRGVDAIMVGTNTGGASNFWPRPPHRLPRSGIQVSVSVGRLVLDGENFRERRGYLPDVWIDLRDDGAMARDLGDCLADPAFRAEAMPLIRDAGERWRDLSIY